MFPVRHRPSRPGLARHVIVATALGLVTLAGVVAGCEDRGDRTISRERFISAMAELRAEAARTPLEGLTEEESTAILARLGVTEEELRAFVDVHGRNVPMMAEVWNEVERRVQADTEGAQEDP